MDALWDTKVEELLLDKIRMCLDYAININHVLLDKSIRGVKKKGARQLADQPTYLG